ncbi:PREDICTED: elongation of very long chain fatty acids protein AAEL008004-like [Dinoponera quadriceps]|uniref:Elongation of very long chain fatty acids protein n=1 Tax=Dinoponera quadriceps TaxID=609295 RepID=A0A6P3XKN5_DINQU|nr:PREDICTED: elongation of very long chain fatty acids protein AAEL008004-like [Dinoponera quadriceps]
MAVTLDKIIKVYTFLNEDLADPRTKDLFLIGNLWCVPFMNIFYLFFANKVGLKFMEKRQPYEINRIIQIYNVLQIIINLYLFFMVSYAMWLINFNFRCEPIDYSNTPNNILICRLTWYYFLLKIVDWLDTIFFILKKKQNNVSFLHLYHHSAVVLGTWIGVKYVPGGQAILLGILNTFIHAIMYTYYLLSSMKINVQWWKKYLTQLQIIQFLILTYQFSLIFVVNCNYPQWIAIIAVTQNVTMLLLFVDFYYKTYLIPANTVAAWKIKANDVSAELNPNGKLKEQ